MKKNTPLKNILRALLAALIFSQTPLGASDSNNKNVQAGLYMPLGFGGQYTPQTWGLNAHIGLGVRIFRIGFGAEAHYGYNYGSLPGLPVGTGRNVLYLGRVDLYPVGDLKFSGIYGGGYFFSDSNLSFSTWRLFAGGRLAFEKHLSSYFSMEPAFTFLQCIDPLPYQTYMLTLSFSLWNEALMASIISGMVSGSMRRR